MPRANQSALLAEQAEQQRHVICNSRDLTLRIRVFDELATVRYQIGMYLPGNRTSQTRSVNAAPFERSRRAADASRDTLWQGNCDVRSLYSRGNHKHVRSNSALLRITFAIEYPISTCPAKSGRLPSNVSIRSDPALKFPGARPILRRVTQIEY